MSNSFDAGATNVHIIVSPDLLAADASIVVLDDGIGMDEAGLKEHWLIGVSPKRDPFICEFRPRVSPIFSKAAAMSGVRFLKGRQPHLPSQLRARQIPG